MILKTAMINDGFDFYKEHPKTCAKDDYWRQVKRTVNGKPVSQEQIDLIVNAVRQGLDLQTLDRLLEICCGNGALSSILFEYCNGGTGVDFSEYLISIAKEVFAKKGTTSYHLGDALEFCAKTHDTTFTKAVCYGSFSYLEFERSENLLKVLFNRFPSLSKVFIGNCPDKDKIDNFYTEQQYVKGIESRPDSPIGIWRTRQEFVELGESCGWGVTISSMPDEYYAASYRYDVVLARD